MKQLALKIYRRYSVCYIRCEFYSHLRSLENNFHDYTDNMAFGNKKATAWAVAFLFCLTILPDGYS
jgi:hypothetical protein